MNNFRIPDFKNIPTCIHTANNKNDVVCIDFLGLLPRAMRGIQNLVVCTNASTKNVSLYVIGWLITEAVLKVILKKYIPHHSHIKEILPDWGKQFQDKKWHSEFQKHDVQAILTSIHRLAERVDKESFFIFIVT